MLELASVTGGDGAECPVVPPLSAGPHTEAELEEQDRRLGALEDCQRAQGEALQQRSETFRRRRYKSLPGREV